MLKISKVIIANALEFIDATVSEKYMFADIFENITAKIVEIIFTSIFVKYTCQRVGVIIIADTFRIIHANIFENIVANV